MKIKKIIEIKDKKSNSLTIEEEQEKKHREAVNKILEDIEKNESHYINKETDSRKALIESYALALHIVKTYLKNDEALVKKINKRLFVTFKVIITEGFKLSTNSVVYGELKERLARIKNVFLKLSLRDKDQILSEKNYSEFFKETEKQFQNIIVNEIFGLCHELMLEALKEYKENYAILGIGSLATKRVTPYSDLGFIGIIDGDLSKNKASKLEKLLLKFSELAELLITALGETPVYIASLALELCLKEDYSQYEKSLKKGQGFRVDENKKSNERNLIVNLSDTIEGILQLDDENEPLQILHRPGKHITSALLSTIFLEGNENLYKNYDQKLIKALGMKKWKIFIIGMIKSDFSAFKEKVLKIDKGEAETINLKEDFLKFLVHLPIELALLGIGKELLKFKNNEIPKTLEDTLDLLLTNEKISEQLNKEIIEDWKLLVKKLMILRVNIQTQNKNNHATIEYQLLEEKIPNLIEILKNINQLSEVIFQYLNDETINKEEKLSKNISNIYHENNRLNQKKYGDQEKDVSENIIDIGDEYQFFFNSIHYYQIDKNNDELLLYKIDLTTDIVEWLNKHIHFNYRGKMIQILESAERSINIEDSIKQYKNLIKTFKLNSEYQALFKIAIYALMIFKKIFYSDLSLPKKAQAVYQYVIELAEEVELQKWKTIRFLWKAEVLKEEAILMLFVVLGLSYGYLGNLTNNGEFHQKCYEIFKNLYDHQFSKDPIDAPIFNLKRNQNYFYLPYLKFIQSIVFESLGVSLQKIKTYEEASEYFELANDSYIDLLDYCKDKIFVIKNENYKNEQIFYTDTIYLHRKRTEYNQLISHFLYIMKNKEDENLNNLIDDMNEYKDTILEEAKLPKEAINYLQLNKKLIDGEDTKCIILGKTATKKLQQRDKNNRDNMKRLLIEINALNENTKKRKRNDFDENSIKKFKN
jgi:hypothetical protein